MDKNNMHISHDLKSNPLHTKLKYLKSHLKLWYAHTKEVRANRKNCILATLRDLDKKIDEGHDTDVDRTTRINRMQELEDLEKLESMDLVQKSRELNGRTINVGRTKAEFDALIFDIASLEPEELVDSDTFIWSLSHDDKFLMNSVRKHIDELSPPSLSPSTRWCKIIPRKVNIFMWQIFLDRLPNHLNLSSRGLDIDLIMCPVCNVSVESSAQLSSLVTRLLLFGISFVFGQFLCSLRFPYVASGIFRFSHGTPQRKRRNALTPSLLLPVRPYGGLEIISLSTLIL
ncbi:RNA-directed DNA polymerase, eukaryota, reverse transcriptase zinc-binding domain protein [Tanacetum coccineum]